MKWNGIYKVSAAVALASTALLAGQAHADCGQRINHQDSECLRVDSNTTATGVTVNLQNLCSDHGTVVAIIDRVIQKDLTFIMNSDHSFTQPLVVVGGVAYNGIYCCQDMGDLCNKSDIVNDESCEDQFRASSANDSCTELSVGATYDYQCEVTAECDAPMESPEPAGITASWPDTDDLRNCEGTLRVRAC